MSFFLIIVKSISSVPNGSRGFESLLCSKLVILPFVSTLNIVIVTSFSGVLPSKKSPFIRIVSLSIKFNPVSGQFTRYALFNIYISNLYEIPASDA